MNIDSSFNNISSKEYVSVSLDKISQTKPGMVSSNLGSLKAISEQIQASTEGIIPTEENVLQKPSKNLRGISNPPVESDDENNLDSEETYDVDVEDVGEVDLEDEGLFGGLDEVENADIKENTSNIREETTSIKVETANVEEEQVSWQKAISQEERELENQLMNKSNKVEESLEVNLHEGAEKVSAGEEEANRTQAEINETNKDVKVSDVAIERVDTSVEQNNVVIDRIQSGINEDRMSIRQEKTARKENIEKLDRLNVTHQVHAGLVDQSINQVLNQAKFRNIYDSRGVPLHANEQLKTELKDNIAARREAEPDAKLSDIIKEEAQKWLVSKDLYEKDDEGNLVRVPSERQRELANLFAREVVNQIIVQVAFSQKIAEANKKEDLSHASLRMSSRSENESVVYPIDGRKLDPEFFETTHKALSCMLSCLLDVELRDVKLQEELKQEMIDLIDRIKQAVVLKDVLKREIQEKEVEHFETTHKMNVIDGTRKEITNKICRFDTPPKENVRLRYPSLYPQVKA